MSAKTVVNPTSLNLATALGSQNVSTIVLATSQYAPELIKVAQSAQSKFVGIAVDTIPIGGQRDGFSIFQGRFKVVEATQLDADDSTTTLRGLTSGRKNWSLNTNLVSVVVNGNSPLDLVIPASNTLFTTGTEATIVTNAPNDTIGDPVLCSSLQLQLQLEADTQSQSGPEAQQRPQTASDSLTYLSPLHQVAEPDLVVTDCRDNMIKTLNNKSAASFLENAPELAGGAAVSSRKVFAAVTSPSGKSSRFQVIAGGGGVWSARAQMLVLEPPAAPKPGDAITFYYSDSEVLAAKRDSLLAKIDSTLESSSGAAVNLVFESSPLLQSASQPPLRELPPNYTIDSVFGGGSEAGVLLDDTKHNVESEVIIASYKVRE